jgi:NADPH2 dehydrogenase
MVGVARQMNMVRQLKAACPQTFFTGSAYTALQDWLPNVAQAAVRHCWTDLVGLGRMILTYPELPLDVLGGKPLQRKQVCRTFSDCTTAPRAGLVSGCYPLDDYYKTSADADVLAKVKKS